MKKLYALILMTMCSLTMFSQGWPANYPGVMLQGFYWIEEPAGATQAQKDSIKQEFKSIGWQSLTKQADELSEFFSLIWVPQSGKASSSMSMGYDPQYWFTHSSAFGSPSELRTMCRTYKALGTGIIADVVLNHRSATSGWLTFPNERSGLDGKYYQIKSTDICANDDGGKTATWAASNGYTLSTTNDEGDDFDGARDLDHTSSNVQTCINAYLDYLLQTLEYTGFRLDMVKGYRPYYTGLYNFHAKPQFSVGEYWDSFDNIVNWMNGTRRDADGNYSASGDVQSGAFDFPLKYKIKSACESGNWLNLYPFENDALAWNSYWPRWAVTFVDNHDSYREGYNRCNSNVMAANAYILCMPGTPCVFMEHWKQYKQQIKQIIYARKLAGVTNQSGIDVAFNHENCFSTRVNGNLEILMGNGFGLYDASENTDLTLVESGDNFAVYLSKSVEAPWISLPTGSYEGPVSVRFTALSNSTETLVYTLDGTTPTANSTQVQSGAAIMLNESATLMVGLLKNGSVVNVQTRKYDITPGEEGQTVINVCTPIDEPYLYVWDVTGTPMNGEWPGTKMTDTFTSSNGTRWFTTTLASLGDINIIFNAGNDQLKTRDITGVTQGTHYFYFDGFSGCDEVTADYKPAPPTTQVTVNVSAPIAPYLYAWTSDKNGTVTQLCGGWPGLKLSNTIVWQGKTYYTRTLSTNNDDLNIIFNDGNGQQTANIEGLTTGNYYYVYDGATQFEEEFFSTPTGITSTMSEAKAVVYDMQGRSINTSVPLRKGVYVQNGKKIVVK